MGRRGTTLTGHTRLRLYSYGALRATARFDTTRFLTAATPTALTPFLVYPHIASAHRLRSTAPSTAADSAVEAVGSMDPRTLSLIVACAQISPGDQQAMFLTGEKEGEMEGRRRGRWREKEK